MSYYSDIDNPPDPLRKRKLHRRYFASVSGAILDIGCSTGNFPQHDPDRIIGIDIDSDALRVARSRELACVRGDIWEGLPFASGVFQAVNCDSVIEHITHPLSLMREIHRVLAPGGMVVVITPDIRRVRHRFWRDYTHVHPLCPVSLQRLAYDAGFREMSVRRYSLNYLKFLSRFSPGGRDGHQPAWWFLEDALGLVLASNIVLRAVK